MADYNVKLKVDTTQHDIAMTRSASQVNNYSKRILETKDKVIGLTSKIPALTLAVGAAGLAFKGFTTVMNSTDSGADALGARMEQLKSITDGFLMSIQMGDFSSFLGGLSSITETAKDAYLAIDDLETHLATSALSHMVSESKLEDYKATINDRSLPKAVRKAAQLNLQKEWEHNESLYDKDILKYETASRKRFDQMMGITEMYPHSGVSTDALYKEFNDMIMEQGRDWGEASQILLDRVNARFEEMGGKRSSLAKQKYSSLIHALERLQNKADSDQFKEYLGGLTELWRAEKEKNLGKKLIVRYTQRELKGLPGSDKVTIPTEVSFDVSATTEELDPIIDSLRDLEKKLKVLNNELEVAIIYDDVEKTRDLLSQIEVLEGRIENKKIELGLKTTDINIPAGPTSDNEAYQKAMDNVGKLQEQLSGSFDTVYSSVVGAESAINSLGSALGDAFNSEGVTTFFKSLQGGLDILNSIYQAYQAVTGVIETINTLKSASIALTEAQQAADVAATTAAIAKTGADSGAAIAGATKSGAGIPFPWNLVAIAAGITAVIGALSLIGKFANGGIVGGDTMIGDRTLARVNKGEMILNNRQQTRLFNLLDGVGGVNTGSATSGNVTFRISGGDLVGVLHNQQKKKSRVL